MLKQLEFVWRHQQNCISQTWSQPEMLNQAKPWDANAIIHNIYYGTDTITQKKRHLMVHRLQNKPFFHGSLKDWEAGPWVVSDIQ